MIKKLMVPILLLSVCFSSCLAAATLQQAESLYRQSQFAAALQGYEELLKNNPKDPYLYYNIGNCYFKMGSNGLAAANYYRAFKLAPRDTDIRNNLSLALSAGGERLVPTGMPEILHQSFYGLSYNELKGLFFIVLWLSCTAGSVWLIKRKFGLVALTLLAVTVLCGGWYWLRAQNENQILAIVATPTAQLRSGPGGDFPASANITQGHLLTVQDSKDNWYEVVVNSQGIKGWVENNAIEKI